MPASLTSGVRADTLPELVVLCILLYPYNYARMGQAYPRPLGQSKDEEGQPQQDGPEQDGLQNGHKHTELAHQGNQNGHTPNGQH